MRMLEIGTVTNVGTRFMSDCREDVDVEIVLESLFIFIYLKSDLCEIELTPEFGYCHMRVVCMTACGFFNSRFFDRICRDPIRQSRGNVRQVHIPYGPHE